jgi:hypothetical protein
MQKIYAFMLLFFLITERASAQLSSWSFEGVTLNAVASASPTITAGSAQADAGLLTTGSYFSGLHASAATVWTTPAGNGSAKSVSANNWGVGDYFQFQFSGSGYQNLFITWDAMGSATGPRDFKVQYSTNGSTFMDATGTNSAYSLGNFSWSPVTPQPASTRTLDLGSITTLNNTATVYIRIVVTSNSAIGGGTITTGGTSRIDNFIVNGTLISGVSQPTDYFQTTGAGNWSNINTWESSADNSTWEPATLAPTSASSGINIRNGHTVSITSVVSADQVTIQSGGLLILSGGIFSIHDGAGDDITIMSNAVFELAQRNMPPIFGAGNPTVNVSTGGILRVSASGLIGAGTGVNANNYIYQHLSILDYTSTLFFATNNVTFFPNVNSTTIPIFRMSNAMTLGSNNPTTFNGIFEINSAVVTWQNAGAKIFRNGIRGSGSVDGLTTGNCGPFYITGDSAELGGYGSITTPAGGLNIGGGSGTKVTLTHNKMIYGFLHLLSNSYVRLGDFGLTLSNPIASGDSTRHIVTNKAGRLGYRNTTTATFPIGHDDAHYNPVSIDGGAGNIVYARVENGIHPSVAFPASAINKTWHLTASDVLSPASLQFQYNAADVNADIAPHPQPLEILQAIDVGWSLLPGNTNLHPAGTDPYTIASLPNISINITEQGYALGKAGGYVLAVDFFITATARKIGNDALIRWRVGEADNIRNFEIQRSTATIFDTIATMQPVANQGDYSFIDHALPKGKSLYRIKVNLTDGGIRYSNTVTVVNDGRDVLINTIMPNPVAGIGTVSVSTDRSTTIEFILTSMRGNIIRKWTKALAKGINTIELNTTGLSPGTYHLGGVAGGWPVNTIRFVKQ